MNIAKRLQALRKENHLSQEEVAERLSISRQAVSKWESGQSTPDLDNLVELSHIYEVTVDCILNGETERVAETGGEPSAGVVSTGAHCPYRKDCEYAPTKERRWETEQGYHIRSSCHWEYRSKRTFLGLPLVHVNFGYNLLQFRSSGFSLNQPGTAKGILAIGNVACGLLAIGAVSFGLLSLGMVSVGLLALGCIAAGGLAIGGVAVGAAAIGGVSLGLLAIGGLAEGCVAVGGLANGAYAVGDSTSAARVAIGSSAQAPLAFATGRSPFRAEDVRLIFAELTPEKVRAMILERYPDTWEPLANLLAGLFR